MDRFNLGNFSHKNYDVVSADYDVKVVGFPTQWLIYSSSHIAQIMDFGEFLHEYREEKSETCTKF